MDRKVQRVYTRPADHWVGDGFHVRTLFSYSRQGSMISPFLLLDHGGPETFAPTEERRGVGEHPHRGFETVTIVYHGEVEHRDSGGHQGKIGPGDVQWMTAASGVVHEEMHSRAFAKRGGAMEMAQLWVNLPAKYKKAPPRYQTLTRDRIPEVALERGAGKLRVIAGAFGEATGPAETFTPLNVWDLQLTAGRRVSLEIPAGYSAILVPLHGRVRTADEQTVNEQEVAVLESEGETVTLETETDATVLVLSGEPIEEPIVGYGPFVMNTEAEIQEAIEDYRNGRMGHLV